MRWSWLAVLVLGLFLAGCPGDRGKKEEEPADVEELGDSDEGLGDDVEDVGEEESLTTVELTFPGDGLGGLSTELWLAWRLPIEEASGVRFDIDVALDAEFKDAVVRERAWPDLDYPLIGLDEDERYFWRVRVHDEVERRPWSEVRSFEVWRLAKRRQVLYQLVVRHFSNEEGENVVDGSIEENGVGKFAGIDEVALSRIRGMGATHLYLTGVLRQATLTDYSEIGLAADDPDILKGRAGSFFAVKDYFDVSPDYALDPARRLEEFGALVERVQAAGMKVMIDLVPNHVARSYGSTIRPDLDLGLNDDQEVFFSPQNNFFYLEGGRPLILPTAESHWQVEGMDGAFEPEDGSAGRRVRVTGNNITSHEPSIHDWYETVKLNYGFDFTTGELHAEPTPATWHFMVEVLRYWMGEFGIDGFRVDFAHYIPAQAWAWIFETIREDFPDAFFVAEAYEELDALLEAGFDLVYDGELYHGLKGIYNGTRDKGGLDQYLNSFSDESRGRYLRYLENHDERRIASPVVRDTYPGDSGFGEARAGRHLGPVAYFFSSGAIMIYNGQTFGEEGRGASGFSGDDGRSTIFDYWRVPALSDWVNGGRFDGGRLDEEQRDLHEYYRRLIHLSHHPLLMGSGYYGLDYFNSDFEDYPSGFYAFARYVPGEGKMMVVVTNWGVEESRGVVRLPADLVRQFASMGARVRVSLIFDEAGEDKVRLVRELTRDGLSDGGFELNLPAGATRVYLLE